MTALDGKARICGHLGKDPKATSNEIAESVNTNPVVIRRMLSQLQQAGLVTSKTGRGGGTTLAKPAHEITLRAIYEAVEEGDLFRLHYTAPNQTCPIGSNIQDAVLDVFSEAADAMKQVLDTKTVADITEEVMTRAGVREHIAQGLDGDTIREQLEKQAGLVTMEA